MYRKFHCLSFAISKITEQFWIAFLSDDPPNLDNDEDLEAEPNDESAEVLVPKERSKSKRKLSQSKNNLGFIA